MKSVLSLALLCGLAAMSFTESPKRSGVETDPCFKALQKILGTWKGGTAKFPVEQSFSLALGGKMIVGHGQVGNVLTMESRFGWDPKVNQPYYLDMHNHDTVYYGHLHLEGDEIVFRFGTIAGEGGEYEAHARFVSPTEYLSQLSLVKDGKVGKPFETIHLKKVK